LAEQHQRPVRRVLQQGQAVLSEFVVLGHIAELLKYLLET